MKLKREMEPAIEIHLSSTNYRIIVNYNDHIGLRILISFSYQLKRSWEKP